jgi:hypothetical protein
MTPERALALVLRYSELTKAVRDDKKRIGNHLELCPGFKGKRREREEFEGVLLLTQAAQGDQKTHLASWYEPEIGEYGGKEYFDIDVEEQAEECPHCYAAHLVIQERKARRRKLAGIKGAITKAAP